MAIKDLNISRNSYRAQLDNEKERQYFGERIEKDPWFRQQEKDLQDYLVSAFTKGEDGSNINLGVAILNRKGISRVLKNTKLIVNQEAVTPYEVNRKVDYYEKNGNILKGYEELHNKGFFSDIINNSGTYSNVTAAYENNAGYQIHQTTKQTVDAIANVFDQQGKAVGWDLETTGGRTVGEKNIGRHVTEFSFVEKNLLTGKQGNVYSSIIGATEEEYKEYFDIIEKYEKGTSDKALRRNGGTPISAEEKVTAIRLAKMGTVFAEEQVKQGSGIDYGKNGVVNFKKFVGDREIAMMDPAIMRKGAEFLRDVGKRQQAAGVQAVNIGSQTFNVLGWEAEFLKGINSIYHGGANGSAVTAIGHNTLTFDIGELNRLISSSKFSDQAKAAVQHIMGGNKNLEFEHHLDTLALTRRFLPDNFYDENDLRQMEQFGLTENQQEAIVRRLTAATDSEGKHDWTRTVYEDPRNAGAAHMAVTDVLRNLEMTESLVFKETGLLRDSLAQLSDITEEPVKLETDSNSLFFAKQHLNEQRYNLLQFTYDALSGEIRTAEGIAMAEGDILPDGSVQRTTKEQLFGQYGMQKGVTYRVNRIFEAATDDSFKSVMRNMYPNLDINQLAVLELQTYAPSLKDKNVPVRAQSPIYYVGLKQDIANAMMDSTYYIGDISIDGSVNTDNVSNFIKRQLTKMSRDATGTVTEKEFNAIDIIEDGARRAEQEAAARNIRQHSYSKDQKLLQFLEFEDNTIDDLKKAAQTIKSSSSVEEVNKAKEKLKQLFGYDTEEQLRKITDTLVSDDNTAKREALYARLWENSTKISKNLSLGNPVQRDELKFSFNEILGFWDRDTKTAGNLYSETLTGQLQRLGWLRQNKVLVSAAMAKAVSLAGSAANNPTDGKDITGYYYTKLMQGVEDYVETEAGKNSERLGWQLDGIYSYEFNRKFDIDLSGYRGLPNGTKVSLNLESQPRYMVNAIIKAAKDDLFSAKDYTSAEQGAILRDVQDYLYRTRQIGHFEDGIRSEHTVEFRANVLSGLTGYSNEFIEEYKSQLDRSYKNPYRIAQGDSVTVASYKLLQSLKHKKETGNFAGHLTETYRHTADPNVWAQTLSETKIDEVLDTVGKEIPHLSGIYSVDPRQNKQVVSESIVNDIVENVLLDKRVTNKALDEAGYSAADKKALLQVRELHKQGLKKYTRTLFEMAGNIGLQTGWDEKSRKLFAISGSRYIDLNMPVETFVDGQLQYRVGPSLLSVPVGIYDQKAGFGDKRELKMTSLFEKAIESNRGLINWYQRQALIGESTSLYSLQNAMSTILKTIREAPAVTTVNLASRGNQFKLQYADLVKNLPTLFGNDTSAIDSWHIDDAYKRVIKDLISGKAVFDEEHPAYEHFIVEQANIDNLLKQAYSKGIIDKDSWENIIANFTPAVKGAQHLAGQVAVQGDFYAQFNGLKRNAPGIEDSIKLNVSDIRYLTDIAESGTATTAELARYEGLRDVEIGKGITDIATYTAATAGSKKGQELNTHVRLTALHATPRSLNALIMHNLGNAVADISKREKSRLQELGINVAKAVSEQSMNLVSTIMPEEGVGFMHGHIFDRIFSGRETLQKLSLRKIIDNDGKTILDLNRKKDVMPLFSGGKFSYGEGTFVAERDIIGHVPGFGISPHGERAKYEGLLKLGAFDIATGRLVEESEIENLIKESFDIDKLSQEAKDVQAKKIVDLLEEKYNLAYYLQTEKANPLVKISEMAEKGMVRALILGTGEADDRIAGVMQELGFYGGNYMEQAVEKDVNGNVVKKQITKTLGKVGALDIKLIDDLVKDNLGSFGTAAKGRYRLLHRFDQGYQDLTTENIVNIIKKHGFRDVEHFREAVEHERYEPSRLMSSVLETAGLKTDKEAFHVITNHLANMKKHGDISAYRYLTDEWLSREKQGLLTPGSTEQLISKYLLKQDEGFNQNVSIEKKGSSIVLLGNVEALEADITKLRQAYLDTGIVKLTVQGQSLSDQEKAAVQQAYINTGETNSNIALTTQTSRQFELGKGVFEKLTNPEGQFIGAYEKIRSEFSKTGNHWDWGKETYDAVKFNQRAITNLSNVRVDEHEKENIRKFLDDRAIKYGTGADIYSKYIKDLGKGEIVNKAAIDQIYRNMFNRQGGGEKLSGFINTDANGNLVWGIDKAAVNRFVERYNVGNGDTQKGINIMTALLGRMRQGLDGHSISTVNEKGAFNLFRAFSATAATQFNTGVIGEEEIQRLGFKKIKLEDLLTGKLGTNDFDESLYGHNWLIDMGEHSQFGDKLYADLPNNKSGRYLAIAADHVEEPGEFREAIVDRPQEKVKLLRNEIDKYLDKARNEGFEGEEQRTAAMDKIRQRVQDVKDAQWNIWKQKGGIMAQATQAWMHDASRNTARGMNLLGTESVDKALDKAVQVNGLQGLMEEVKNRRAMGKAVDISQLKINGISLVEEAQKGRNALQFNYSILSLDRMNKIYDTGFGEISDAFVNAGMDKNTVDQLISDISATTKRIAQTEGVEGISAREPLQYRGSVTQRKIFFNSLASGNEAIGDFTGAQWRKEDYDSDAVVNALHKEQAELTVGDRKVAIEVDSAMLAALNSQKMKDAGVSIRLLDEGAEERFKNYQTSQFFTAAGEAQRYRIVSDFTEGAPKYKPLDSMNFEDLAKQLEPFDPTLSKKVLQNSYMNFTEREKANQEILRSVYRNMVKNASFDQETYGADFLTATGETQRLRILEQLEKGAAAAGTVLGSDDSNLAYQALRFSFHDRQLNQDMMAFAGRVPTGKINRYTQNVFDVLHEVLHREGAADYFKKDIGVLSGQIGLVNLAMQEGFLSPKNETEGGTATKSAEELRTQLVPRLDKAYNDVFNLGDNADSFKRAAAKKQLSDVLLDVIMQRTDKEMSRNPELPTLLDLLQEHGEEYGKKYGVNYKKIVSEVLGAKGEGAAESILEKTARSAAEAYADFLVEHVGWHGNNKNVFSFATSHSSGNAKNIPIRLPKESAQAPIQLFNALGDVMKELGVKRPILTSEAIGPRTQGQKLDNFAQNVIDRTPPLDISSVPEHNTENIASLKRSLQKAKGKNLLYAGIGIAGGLMVSGFANNPSKPLYHDSGNAFGNAPIPSQSLPDPATQMAANGAAITQYPITLSDSNLNVMRGAPPRTYMINISGASPGGQQVAANAIQAAISGPVPQNTSINVAMNNNYADTLNQAQVGRMIQTAMGF